MNQMTRTSFNSSVNNINTYPSIGMGFLYRLRVKRKGLKDATYVGLTTRSVKQRYNEHISDSRKLGILGPSVLRNAKQLGYNPKNGIHAIIRTGMGITRERERNHLNYLSVEIIGQYSLFSLGEREKETIKREMGTKGLAKSSGMQNYNYLRYRELMNRTPGGESINWFRIPYFERVISAYNYLKNEAILKPESEEELMIMIVNIVSNKNNKSYNKTVEKSSQKIRQILNTYLSAAESIELAQSGVQDKIRTRSEMNIMNSIYFRNTGKEYGGYTPEDFRRLLFNNLKSYKLRMLDNGIYQKFNSSAPKSEFKGRRETGRSVINQVAAEIHKASYEMIKNINFKRKK